MLWKIFFTILQSLLASEVSAVRSLAELYTAAALPCSLRLKAGVGKVGEMGKA